MSKRIAHLLGALACGVVLGYLIAPKVHIVAPSFTKTFGRMIYSFQEARRTAAYSASLMARSPLQTILMPVVGVEIHEVADSFGAARSEGRLHEGTDIFGARGRTILSATEGVVVRVGVGQRGGNYVFILGPGGERYYYAHLDWIDPSIHEGVRVTPLTILGGMGTTGNATGTPPHLHFGIYGRGGALNPYDRLSNRE